MCKTYIYLLLIASAILPWINPLASAIYNCTHNNPCIHGNCSSLPDQTPAFKCLCQPGYTGSKCDVNIDDCIDNKCRHGGICKDGVDKYECVCNGTGFEGRFCEKDVDECKRRPCVNGKCQNLQGSYSCICTKGYRGENCEINIDDCSGDPCKNGGTCKDLVAGYSCICPSGYSGRNCDENIDDCENASCPKPNTRCRDLVDSFECVCKPGYEEKNGICTDLDECKPDPCLYGNCRNLENNYTCDCNSGYTGRNCSIQVDDCQPNPCLNNGICKDKLNDYSCQCSVGFSGKNCSENINDCLNNPCKNGAKCIDQVNAFKCECKDGWIGKTCGEDFDECLVLPPCENGGKCVNTVGSFKCTCANGFTGPTCKININDCHSDSCPNGGTCIDGIAGYTCQCATNWMGRFCLSKYDACKAKSCIHGNCTLIGEPPSYNYTCSCDDGYTGQNCSENIDDCANAACPTGKVCVDGVNTYECKCPTGYHGTNCAEDIDECKLSPPICNFFDCNNTIGSYDCDCFHSWVNHTSHYNKLWYKEVGFKGKNCDIAIDVCSYKPPICLNGGGCNELSRRGYSCTCANGFQGTHCEISFTSCQFNDYTRMNPPQPACLNNATCVPKPDLKFDCVCHPGYKGDRCEIDIDECALYTEQNNEPPCLYNGTCVDRVNAFDCTCIPGITGRRCDVNIDDCNPDPCVYGSCLDRINGYTCNCSDTGFKGENCSININDCENNLCKHGSQCVDGIKSYTCSCHPGYTGQYCEVDINECQSQTCSRRGRCYQRSKKNNYPRYIPGVFSYQNASGFYCRCQPGFNGSECENDIDECLLPPQPPCLNGGTCRDAVNKFMCNCKKGYHGSRCQIETDECLLYQPCRNGGVCSDMAADYNCYCPNIFTNRRYSGKNCTTKLQGCDGSKCQNGGTCLVESDQRYKCRCKDGFFGNRCENDATVSFSANSHVSFTQVNVENFTVAFITKQNDFSLCKIGGEKTFLVIFMRNLKLCFAFYKEKVLNSDECISSDLPGKTWHTVKYARGMLSVNPDSCPDCSISITSTQFADTPLSFSSTQVPAGVPFIGCLRALAVNGVMKAQFDVMKSGTNILSGCRKKNMCKEDSCMYRGTCKNLWFGFTCDCIQPYYGQSCEKEFVPVVFGLDSKKSYMEYKVDNFNDNLRLSFFVQTSSPNAVIAYYGSNAASSSAFYIMVAVVNGAICLVVNFCTSKHQLCNTDASQYSIGQRYYIEALITKATSSLVVNGVSLSKSISLASSCQPNVDTLSFGSVPLSSRRKRQVTTDPLSLPSFVGSIQGVKVNGRNLITRNDTAASGLLPNITSNIVPTTDVRGVCSQQQPCINGNCVPDYSNLYKCECSSGFAGRNCSENDNCVGSQCPASSQCYSYSAGYECVGWSSFKSKPMHYSADLKDLQNFTDISFNIRTKSPSGSLLYAVLRSEFFWFHIRLSNGRILIENNFALNGSRWFVSTASVNDGLPRIVTFKKQSNKQLLRISLSGSWPMDAFSDWDGNMIHYSDDEKVDIFVGAAPGTPYSNFFGCLNDVRINQNIVPFYEASLTNQIFTSLSSKPTSGCQKGDMCAGNPCKNGGKCIDRWNAYECDCPAGYIGYNCQVNVDDCEKDSCSGNGECLDGNNAFSCSCFKGFIGDRCQAKDSSQCSPNPCSNMGYCLPQEYGRYTCNCSDEYFGRHCAFAKDTPCSETTCINGTCSLDLLDNSTCQCHAGFTGQACDIPINNCDNCISNNTKDCHLDSSPGNFTCVCKKGYSGSTCNETIDVCDSSPCLNSANCSSTYHGGYQCLCVEGWIGNNCEISNHTCSTRDPCIHGRCIDSDKGIVCNCSATGFKGETCSEDIDECKQFLCRNGATCLNKIGNYTCNCTAGYIGHQCDVPSCSNHVECREGTCRKNSTTWWCDCPKFITGNRCEIKGPCAYSPCENGVCSQPGFPLQRQHLCACNSGWRGDNCTEDILECSELKPCQNNGNCSELPGSYRCTCLRGYSDHNCSTNINECANASCSHQSLCVDLVNDYLCNCSASNTSAGYQGRHCDVDINECLNNPCLNDAKCENLPGSYRCNCKSGYTGRLCQMEAPSTDPTITIVIVVVIIIVVVLVIVVSVFIYKGRQSRSKSGTYNPSSQEMTGARVELNHVIKKDPVEKLI